MTCKTRIYTVTYHYYGHDRVARVRACSPEDAKRLLMDKLAERLSVKVIC